MRNLLADKDLLVAVGPGGVGKTTISAAMGLEAARRGRNVLVLTIDPAKRLAQALGLTGLDDQVQEVSTEELAVEGVDGVPALSLDVADGHHAVLGDVRGAVRWAGAPAEDHGQQIAHAHRAVAVDTNGASRKKRPPATIMLSDATASPSSWQTSLRIDKDQKSVKRSRLRINLQTAH